MQLYFYAKSGHNYGLENIRRVSAVFNMLKSTDPILCSADYRAATFAKEFLGVTKGVGVDVIGNLPHVMERGDMLIYDSNEASETMTSHMKDFCKHIYKIGEDIPFEVVDETFTTNNTIKNEKAVFFSDDDYANWFFDLVLNGTKHNIPLVLGHYFFLGNEDKLEEFFSDVLEEDGYIDTIKTTKYLLTSSINSCFESISCGNSPVYFKRQDKEIIENIELLEKYNIPIIDIPDTQSFDTIYERFETIIQNYPTLNKIEKFDISDIRNDIEKMLKLFEAISPSLEYKF